MKLDNDLIVKLLGIKPKKDNIDGINYLKLLTKGKKILLQFDDKKYDKLGNLLCYVYLYNKTFINTNLLSKGFADVDLTINHSKEKLFNRYRISNE
ncbi:MAG TPA: thermonuclease family protein [Melioribacteraceae bacterium]|nr:thermonuclease family protein [Melioribacteraceae bacterium]